ncbi:hypothetical protein GALMADRAFT_1303792 [Galerina marginata CBS 339.88]|uniref:Uncharacterized protein n=1 Tax=Galerina marginata (strain CBS 339.88) TaxID=685588 RepID=A0A067TGN4_GALM3|nr:hypothetical protein GALMADRAFT_1303792 [Galerina marginata CBS 339.88]
MSGHDQHDRASIARGIRGGAPGRQVQTRGRGTSTPSSSIPISSNRAVTRMPNATMSRGVDSSSRARASILQSARQVGIQGGTFNTAGAHQLNFTFH